MTRGWFSSGRLALAACILLLAGAQASYVLPSWHAPRDLPREVAWTTAQFWDDQVYLFGGESPGAWNLDEIVRFDATTGESVVLAAKLPFQGRALASAIDPDTGHIYLFGGRLGAAPWWSDQIIRFDPATHAVDVMGATLPTPTAFASAAWVDGKAYLFGGNVLGGGLSAQIVRYDPQSDTATPMGATLPFARYGAAAVSTGDEVFLFGGHGGGVGYTGQIVRYDPQTDQVSFNYQAPLPTPRGFVVAVWDEATSTAWVLGGTGNEGNLDEVVTITVLPNGNYVGDNNMAPLPSPRYAASAATGIVHEHAGAVGVPHLYVFGGFAVTPSVGYFDDVVDYTLW